MMAANVFTKSLAKGQHFKCMTLMDQFPHQPISDDAFSVLLDTQLVVACAMMSHHTYQSFFCGSQPSYYPPSLYDVL